jgi:hypothetical protein
VHLSCAYANYGYLTYQLTLSACSVYLADGAYLVKGGEPRDENLPT